MSIGKSKFTANICGITVYIKVYDAAPLDPPSRWIGPRPVYPTPGVYARVYKVRVPPSTTQKTKSEHFVKVLTAGGRVWYNEIAER